MAGLNLKIGAQLHCTDGRCGRVRKVVVDPKSRQVTDLVVEKGLLQKEDLVLPVSLVERATEQDLFVDIDARRLNALRPYREREFVEPAPGWQPQSYRREEVVHLAPYGPSYRMEVPSTRVPLVRQRVREGVPEESAVLGRGTRVVDLEGAVGTVDHVLVDAKTARVTHLIVDRGLLGGAVIVPLEMAHRIGDGEVYLDVKHEALHGLPHYTPRAEAELRAELEERLQGIVEGAGEVSAALENGIVRLTGVVRDVAAKRQAEAAARSCSGVVDVENALDTNTAIVARITAALACDPRTELAVVEVISEQGLVTLKGRVDSPQEREAAEEIAREQQGVVKVINALEVRPDEASEALRVRTLPIVEPGELGRPGGAQ